MFSNKYTDGVFVMPKKVLKYAGNAKKTELRVIMYLFANLPSFSIERAAEELGESVDTINSALSFWRGTGIISEGEDEDKADEKNVCSQDMKKSEESEKAPSEKGYSTIEIANARKSDKVFSQLVDYVESATGELLNSAKQGDLLYLYDNLGMQCDVIMGIVAHCANEDKTKIRYIVKTAESIHKDGVRSYKELESYFAAKNKYREYSAFVKKLIGAGDRAFTPGEEKTVKKWESEMCISRELLQYAYERTIALISKPSLPYMSKIIEGWHESGIKTVEEARAQSENRGKTASSGAGLSDKAKKAGFDINLEDIFEKP